MDSPTSGILGRVGEKVLTGIIFALLIVLAVGVYRMGPEARGAIISGIGRTLVWIGIAALLPWSVRLFIRRLIEIGQNWVGLALITGLTVIDVVVGLILIGGLPAGGWGWFSAVTALGIVATYNYLVCEYLADRHGSL